MELSLYKHKILLPDMHENNFNVYNCESCPYYIPKEYPDHITACAYHNREVCLGSPDIHIVN